MVQTVKRHIAFTLIMVFSFTSLFWVLPSQAQSFGTIHVRSDGIVDPAAAPIQHVGGTYRLLENIYNSPILLECGGIIFDGGGYTLEGAGGGIALNVTCSNVTVRNIVAVNWEVGILGAYNNNSICNCSLNGNEKAIAIYADNYTVTENYVVQNEWGIRVKGNNITVTENHVLNNTVGIWVDSYGGYSGNTIARNTIEVNGQIAIETELGGGFQVHHNNFIINNAGTPIVSTAYSVIPGDETQVVMPPWDNGQEGNYWSNYASKYPNATEIGTSGIGDTPYVINVAPDLSDRHPLVKQVALPVAVVPAPSTSPAPQETPSKTKVTTTPESTVSPASSPSLQTDNLTQNPDTSLLVVGGIVSAAAAAIIAAAVIATRKKHYSRGKSAALTS